MKRKILRIVLTVVGFIGCMNINASYRSVVFTLMYVEEIPKKIEDDDPIHKVIPNFIDCELNVYNGILSLDSGTTLEQEIGHIDLYEICDLNEEVLYAFYDEQSFLRCLFTLKGCHIIRFTNKEYVLTGSVDI